MLNVVVEGDCSLTVTEDSYWRFGQGGCGIRKAGLPLIVSHMGRAYIVAFGSDARSLFVKEYLVGGASYQTSWEYLNGALDTVTMIREENGTLAIYGYSNGIQYRGDFYSRTWTQY